ncbi:MAG: 50S ribosome-binding GTPase, partial [Ramlibacter sp.]|nr:50S ribosome-binding GTPase [Ramlibacter sp.]
FNSLVKARAYAADQLFATLDTTTRQLWLADADESSGGTGRSVSLSDTVGFIRDLPHGLIEAFQATLQEAVDADLLLHVVDAANPNHPEQIAEVQRVLQEIGAGDVPQVLVFNKTDMLAPEQVPVRTSDMFELDGKLVPRVFVSGRTAQGVPDLRRRLAIEVARGTTEVARGTTEVAHGTTEVAHGTTEVAHGTTPADVSSTSSPDNPDVHETLS